MKAFDNAVHAVPAHVPAALVYEYDHMTDARLSPDAHAGCAAIAAEAPPIFFTPRYCGHWVVTRYADVRALSRDTEHLSTRRYNLFGVDEPRVVFPMTLDPPQHTRFRAPLTQAFSPREVAKLLPHIRQEAAGIVDAIRPRLLQFCRGCGRATAHADFYAAGWYAPGQTRAVQTLGGVIFPHH